MLIISIVVTIGLIAAIVLLLGCLRPVRIRQVLLIRGRITGTVHRTVVGPRIALVWPFQFSQSLDLTMQAVQLNMDDLVTTDLAVAASLDIFYTFDPAFLRNTDLNRILPALAGVEKIVQSWANYILRSLAAGYTTTELLTLPSHRAHLESLLRNTLQDRVQPLGIRIHTIRVLCRPAPMILEAQLAAAHTRLTAHARAQALAMLAAALGPETNVTQILPLELLQKIQQGDTMTALNLSLPATSGVNSQDSLGLLLMLGSR
ncbi:MAG: hypothetical protein KDI79_20590 [Anaerolineae bacterium]|nr:hypothetical protein [Anaerolineae bacterium]